MAFSRRGDIGEERVELNGLVRRIGEMSGRLLPKAIVLAVRESETPLWITGNPGSLEQVLMNLVINARDAMPRGGELTLRVEERLPLPEELDEFRQGLPFIQGRMACVSVCDDGAGMDPEILRNLFEPFFTTKPVGQGTGLGLSTAYAMVRQHQGAIAVRSAPGQGSDFKLFFPAAKEDGVPAGATPAKHLAILVEDEESVRKVTQEMLRHLGLDVAAYASAEDLLAAPATTGARVLVSDWLLPGMNGLDLIRRIRGRHPGLPAILITGCDEEQVRRAGPLPDWTRVLHKPFRMAQFQEAMSECMG